MREPETDGGRTFKPGAPTTELVSRSPRRLQAIANDPTIDGVVVTHGTNIMAETGWFMDLVVQHEEAHRVRRVAACPGQESAGMAR